MQRRVLLLCCVPSTQHMGEEAQDLLVVNRYSSYSSIQIMGELPRRKRNHLTDTSLILLFSILSPWSSTGKYAMVILKLKTKFSEALEVKLKKSPRKGREGGRWEKDKGKKKDETHKGSGQQPTSG